MQENSIDKNIRAIYNVTNSHVTKSHNRGDDMDFNYFSYLCFGWAAIGIITRIIMVVFGDKWNQWEMNKAYTEKKPIWIYFIAGFGFLLIAFTWYQVFSLDVKYSWIIAILISLTLIKISALLFNYDKFREFASNTLNNPKKRAQVNLSVFGLSIIFIILGGYVY